MSFNPKVLGILKLVLEIFPFSLQTLMTSNKHIVYCMLTL